MRADIVPGAVFPDYELSDHRGKHRKLFEPLASGVWIRVRIDTVRELDQQYQP